MSAEKLPGEEKTIDGDVVPNTASAPAAGLEREDVEVVPLQQGHGPVDSASDRVAVPRSDAHVPHPRGHP